MIDKGVCHKGFIWNPSNCECECDKLCDVGEYLDYENCKCRKRLIEELVEESSEITDEVKIAKTTLMELHSTEGENKCKSSCTICCLVIVFTICIGTGTYFIYYKYMNHNKKLLPINMIISIKHQIINVNGKYQRNKH